ncbi:flagellar assembly protein FliH [Hydrogenispora ethanolica]|uniref:Flagellar assembly protein FliH n=1 Tax=Hydrogenispora ethanolica TaxID=1082276 RepID=A0A4R1RK37_HYDET|nr:FliH/SctL family protein [Hydrogenispora ethanolica]TCL66541.1 flagellar assembly protein FliH [Hydrogenispora ethanolica]
MSKLIKSSYWTETLPCRLEPVDLEAFLQDEEFDEDLEIHVETSADPVEGPAVTERLESLIRDARREAKEITGLAENEARTLIDDAKREKEELLQHARAEAERILAEARDQALKLREDARREGEAAGRKEARKEWSAKLTEAAQLIATIEAERLERIAGSEPELLRLAAAIAEKIIGAELTTDPHQHLELVRNALSRVANASSILLKVHPEDAQWLSEHLPELREVFQGPTPLQLENDETIPRGGCYIETERGSVDARVKLQLERLLNELLKAGTGV